MNVELEQIKNDVEAIINMDLSVNSRKQPFIYYRHMYMKLATMYSNASYEEIGKLVNRDHSTVTHVKQKFEYQLPYFKDLRENYAALTLKYKFGDGLVVKNVDLLKSIILA